MCCEIQQTPCVCTDQPTPHVQKAAFTIAAGSSWEPASPTAAGLYPQTVKSEQSLGFVKSPCKAQRGLRHSSTKASYGFVGGSSCLGLLCCLVKSGKELTSFEGSSQTGSKLKSCSLWKPKQGNSTGPEHIQQKVLQTWEPQLTLDGPHGGGNWVPA